MKKRFFFSMMPMLALALIMSIFSSCGNKNNNATDEGTGCSAEDQASIITCVTGYITSEDNKYLAADLRTMIAQFNESIRHEPWSILWNTGSDVEIKNVNISDFAQEEDGMVKATCVMTCSCYGEDENFDETFYIDMKKENGQWVIYEIVHRDETARELLMEGILAEEEDLEEE